MIKKLIPSATVAAIFVFAVWSAQVVFAHSRPIRFEPSPGAVLSVAPSTVTGWFTQPLRRDPNWNFLQVTDAQGNRVDTRAEPVLSADRKQMTVTLNSGLPAGRYLVTWRTWDDNDGRIFGDCYAFFVGQAAADASVTANTRLDGGNTCQRIDISGTQGTPVAGGTPQATAAPVEEGHEDEGGEGAVSTENDGEDSDDGVPVWTLVLAGVVGIVFGGVGGKMISGRA
jgi:methionine-rich copper-binding protein CopC